MRHALGLRDIFHEALNNRQFVLCIIISDSELTLQECGQTAKYVGDYLDSMKNVGFFLILLFLSCLQDHFAFSDQ